MPVLFQQTRFKSLIIALFTLCLYDVCQPVFAQISVPLPQQKPQQSSRQSPQPPPVPTAPFAAKPADDPPDTKPARIYQAACLPLVTKHVDGKVLKPIKQDQCEVQSPLELIAINQPVLMRFDQPVISNCSMAVALTAWAAEANALAQKHFDSSIRQIGTGSHYQCRKVNNGSQGRISEHAFANALDVMSLTLQNGEVLKPASDWKRPGQAQQFWKDLHAKSCTMFMTVLGPEADSAHANHLHLDMGCHGADCTFRICQ